MLIETKRDGRTVVVTLNDPAKRNALSPDMRAEMVAALDPVMLDRDVRAVVLVGQGNHFCAGGDLKSMKSGDPIYARTRMMITARLVRLLAAGPVPVIAAVEGAAFGAGLSLAALADINVVSRTATFGAVFGKIGLMADVGLLWALPNRIGAARAKRFLLQNTVVKADVAPNGLIDQLCEPGQALGHAMKIAASFENQAPLPLAATKSAFSQMADFDRALALEADLQGFLMASADHEEGRAAFFDKRDPVFKGA
ncbi:enoyl-CoA hydratase/isomerase family protein [Loktanella sp. DJP18]|uniref:enoyl-CoA hydratase/isomerase family protein n=1 Tax=Loktanella sp. DJP18 TaxID=3409788 RepID=UPI003BB67C81